MNGNCEIEGCNRNARWSLYRQLPTGEKEWVNVCEYHWGPIARENLARAGGLYTKAMKEANSRRLKELAR